MQENYSCEQRKAERLTTTSTELATIPPAQRDIVDGWTGKFDQIMALSTEVCETDFVPKDLKGNPGATLACIMTGRELGIGPMASFRFVMIVEGSATLSAEYKRAQVLSKGHEFEILDWTSTRCKVRGRRAGAKAWTEVTYTIDDARKANLMKPRGAWFTRPRRMLLARASSDLCDAIFPDVTNGLPTTELVLEGQYVDGQLVEEMGDDTAAQAEGPPAPAEPAVRRTRAPRGTGTKARKSTAAKAAPPEPEGDDGEEIFDAEIIDESGQETLASQDDGQPGPPDDQAQAEQETGPEQAEDPLGDDEPSAEDGELAGPQTLRTLSTLFRNAGVRTGVDKLALTARVTGHEYQGGEAMQAAHALAVIDVLRLALKKPNPHTALAKIVETAERDRLNDSETEGD
jgi:hypothetical protein